MLEIRDSKFCLSCKGNRGSSYSSGPAENWTGLLQHVGRFPEKATVTVHANIIFKNAPGLHVIELLTLDWPPSKEELEGLKRLLAETPLAIPDTLVVTHKTEFLDTTPAQ